MDQFLRVGADQLFSGVDTVVFLDIEDIETIVQNIREGDFTFVDCLREKLSHDEANFYSFNDFYWGQFVPGDIGKCCV